MDDDSSFDSIYTIIQTTIDISKEHYMILYPLIRVDPVIAYTISFRKMRFALFRYLCLDL